MRKLYCVRAQNGYNHKEYLHDGDGLIWVSDDRREMEILQTTLEKQAIDKNESINLEVMELPFSMPKGRRRMITLHQTMTAKLLGRDLYGFPQVGYEDDEDEE